MSDEFPARFATDVAIVGGCGRVGLPLGIALADAGLTVVLYDRDHAVIDMVRAGKMPFREDGADEALERLVAQGKIVPNADPAAVSEAEYVVVVIGTPVDEHFNPDTKCVLAGVEGLTNCLRDGQHMILRSTVYPGVTAMVERLLQRHGCGIEVSFCPERIAEGRALRELRELPQIVSCRSDEGFKRAAALFGRLTSSIIRLDVEEAELAKLFTNTWRYIKFAAANQLFMIANDFGIDYERVRAAIGQDYPRAADLPSPGLAAGPCLLKDTMQLAAFNNNNFTLGHASMTINEGLPLYLTARLEQQYDLSDMTVGILGMAFKAESDDTRSSLAYKLKRLLKFKARRVFCTDPYVRHDHELWPLDLVLAESDLLVIAAPHKSYTEIDFAVPVVDPFNLLGRGVRV
jgi:UDP-N-acetyl-D-mannosaminuronic acid dehydrogenase